MPRTLLLLGLLATVLGASNARVVPEEPGAQCRLACSLFVPLPSAPAANITGTMKLYELPLGSWGRAHLTVQRGSEPLAPMGVLGAHVHTNPCSFASRGDARTDVAKLADGRPLEFDMLPDMSGHHLLEWSTVSLLPHPQSFTTASLIVEDDAGDAFACCDLQPCSLPDDAQFMGRTERWTIYDQDCLDIVYGYISVSAYKGQTWVFADLALLEYDPLGERVDHAYDGMAGGRSRPVPSSETTPGNSTGSDPAPAPEPEAEAEAPAAFPGGSATAPTRESEAEAEAEVEAEAEGPEAEAEAEAAGPEAEAEAEAEGPAARPANEPEPVTSEPLGSTGVTSMLKYSAPPVEVEGGGLSAAQAAPGGALPPSVIEDVMNEGPNRILLATQPVIIAIVNLRDAVETDLSMELPVTGLPERVAGGLINAPPPMVTDPTADYSVVLKTMDGKVIAAAVLETSGGATGAVPPEGWTAPPGAAQGPADAPAPADLVPVGEIGTPISSGGVDGPLGPDNTAQGLQATEKPGSSNKKGGIRMSLGAMLGLLAAVIVGTGVAAMIIYATHSMRAPPLPVKSNSSKRSPGELDSMNSSERHLTVHANRAMLPTPGRPSEWTSQCLESFDTEITPVNGYTPRSSMPRGSPASSGHITQPVASSGVPSLPRNFSLPRDVGRAAAAGAPGTAQPMPPHMYLSSSSGDSQYSRRDRAVLRGPSADRALPVGPGTAPTPPPNWYRPPMQPQGYDAQRAQMPPRMQRPAQYPPSVPLQHGRGPVAGSAPLRAPSGYPAHQRSQELSPGRGADEPRTLPLLQPAPPAPSAMHSGNLEAQHKAMEQQRRDLLLRALQYLLDTQTLILHSFKVLGPAPDPLLPPSGPVRYLLLDVATRRECFLTVYTSVHTFRREFALYRRPDLQDVLPKVRVIQANEDGAAVTSKGLMLPPFIITDRGQSLDEVIRLRAPDLKQCVGILTEIARRLVALHRHGVVHRSLRPSTVVKRNDTQDWTLVDYSCSVTVGQISTLEFVLPYAAPEVVTAQQCGQRELVARAALDMWSCGIVAHELLTRRPTFPTSASAEQVSGMIRGAQAAPWEDVNVMYPGEAAVPRLAAALRQQVRALLSRDPASRPTAVELLAGLEQLSDADAAPPATLQGAPMRNPPAPDSSDGEGDSDASTSFRNAP